MPEMPPSAKEAAQRWHDLTRNAAQNFTAGVDAIEMAKAAYIGERLTLEEFEAEVGKLLAEAGR